MAFLDEYLKKKEPSDQAIPGLPLNSPLVAVNGLGDIGLELEIEALNLPSAGHLADIQAPKSMAMWSPKRDGSLRGESAEFVVTTPIYAEELEFMLSRLWEKFTRHQTRFNLSNRCSTHVHINMGGKKINEITSIICLWTAFEEALINWCGVQRKTNHFCLSVKDSNNLIRGWENLLSRGRYDFPEGRFKYAALNVATLPTLGSLEFRTMAGSTTYQPIIDWAKFLKALVDYAVTRFPNPSLIANDLSERPAREIFGEICQLGEVSVEFFDTVLSLEENKDFERSVLEGFRRSQSLSQGFPWNDWMKEVNKVYIPNPFDEGGRRSPRSSREGLRLQASPISEEMVRTAQRFSVRTDSPRWFNEVLRDTPQAPVPNRRRGLTDGAATASLVEEITTQPAPGWLDVFNDEEPLAIWDVPPAPPVVDDF
jgi:hypothetical protein